MTAFARMRAMSQSPINTWGRRAYEDDIVRGRFFGRSSFILNTPDAIRHVLVDNYENYTRTPVGLRVLRPMLGEGLLIAEGRAWKHQRRTLAPAFTPRAVASLVPHMLAVTDETIAKLHAASRTPGGRQERRRPDGRSVRPDGRRARSRDRGSLQRRTARRPGRDHDPRRPRDHRNRVVLVAVSLGARSRDAG